MSSIIKVDQIQLADGSTPTAGDLGLNVSGSVLQVVQVETTTEAVISSQSDVSTGISASITPSSTSSKILILIDAPARHYTTGDNGFWARYRLYRNGSALTNYRHFESYTTGTHYAPYNVGLNHLDSPSTTDEVTYTMYAFMNSTTSSRQLKLQPDSKASTITLMEIAG
jgi:hypothetical protein